MTHLLAPVFQTGFFESAAVGRAVLVAALASVVAGALGVPTVMRRQSFAGEALGDIGASGGSGAFLAGVAPLWGFIAAGVSAAGAMELIGIQRERSRDLATGIVLGAALGVAALLLYLASTVRNTTGAAVTVLFGSLFTVSASTIPLVAVLAALVALTLALIHRPLLLASVSPDIAAARGVRVRAVGVAHLLALALAMALCALSVGAILSTALLIGPAAAALRLTDRPGRAMAAAALIGTLASFGGIVLSYDSYYWPPRGTGWPVSFFVVALVFGAYLLSGLARGGRRARRERERGGARGGA